MSVPRTFNFGGAHTGFPKKLYCKHRIAGQTELPNIGTTIQWSCNGMYDPELSIVGGQPAYFDQLSAIYHHYTVFRSRLLLDVLSSHGYPGTVACYIAPGTAATLSWIRATEQPGAKQLTVPSANGAGHARMTMTWSAKEYFGGDIYDNDNLQGNDTTNPTEQSYYTLITGLTAASGGELTGLVSWVLEYEAVWDELRTIPVS